MVADLEEIREGAARIHVPKVYRLQGPGRRGREVFYNPAMVVARDLTVAAIAASTEEGDRILDGMCATGVMGIRAVLESPHGLTLTLCDRSADSVALAERNLARNSVSTAEIVRGDLNAIVSERRFQYVDIDPFGSPAPYLDAVLRESRDRQVISATATDLAVLCGAHPRACLRRYGAMPLKTPFVHELAVRILLGHCASTAARYDLAIEPMLSAHAAHFVKVWFRVRRGATRADDSLSQVAHFRYDPETGDRKFVEDPRAFGPVWSGALLEKEVLERVKATSWTAAEACRILELLRLEVGAPGLHHTTDEWGKRLKVSPPKLRRIMDALEEAGFQASPTHFHPRGFRTDASAKETRDVFRATALMSR